MSTLTRDVATQVADWLADFVIEDEALLTVMKALYALCEGEPITLDREGEGA